MSYFTIIYSWQPVTFFNFKSSDEGKNVLRFQKYCPAFFWGFPLFVQKILLSYLRSKPMIHQPWVFRKSFFWNPSKTNSFTIEFIFVFLKINKKVGHAFKQWSILLHCAKCLKEICCMWNLYENLYATQDQILLIRS